MGHPGRRAGGAGAGRTVPAAVAGLLVGSALGASLFLLAAFVHERWFDRSPEAPPAGTVPAGDPRARVRVYAGAPRDGADAVLVPFREDGVPAPGAEGILDAELLPGRAAHRWYRLLLTNRDAAVPLDVSLGGGALAAEFGGAFVPCADLPAAWAARSGDLVPHRRMALHLLRAADASVQVPPRGSVRVLVAFPAPAGAAAEPASVRLADGTRLWPLDVTVESVRAALGSGDGRRLEPASVAEARGPASAR